MNFQGQTGFAGLEKALFDYQQRQGYGATVPSTTALKAGQITVEGNGPNGKSKRVVVTLVDFKLDPATQKRHGSGAKRRQQLLRVAQEAAELGVFFKQSHLALMLGCTTRAISGDIAHLAKVGVHVHRHKHQWPAGKELPARLWIVKQWLAGAKPDDIAKTLQHHSAIIDDRIATFCLFSAAEARFGERAARRVPNLTKFAAQECELMLKKVVRGEYQRSLKKVLQTGLLVAKEANPAAPDPLAAHLRLGPPV